MWFDVILGVIIGASLVGGFIKGGIREAFGIVGVVLGIVIGLRFYSKIATLFPLKNQLVVKTISFIIIFGIILFGTWIVGHSISSLLNILRLRSIDRIIGALLGMIKGSLVAGIICFLLSFFPYGRNLLSKSSIAPLVFSELRLLRSLFPEEIRKRLIWQTPRQKLLIN